jgi:hypothetical protein
MKPSELFTKITTKSGLYNIQAIANIPSVMRRGLLSNENAQRIRHVSIAMEEVQEKRNVISIPSGLRLHQYVNLYFDPHNPMLSRIRNDNETICILEIERAILDCVGVVLTDRNASSTYASFYMPIDGLENINFEKVYALYWTDEDKFRYFEKKSIKCAEVLVPYKIPFDYVVSALVVNEYTQLKLEEIGFDRRIVVKPNLFF